MAGVIDTSDFRKGLKIEIDGEPFEIVEFQHVKAGKPDIEEKDMQFLYVQGEDFYFMDTRNYEQTFISEKVLGEAKNFLKENINASILFYNGKAIGVSLPNSVELKVVKCDPGIRGDTVSGALKPAVLETGYTVQVPLFINEGDVLK